MLREKIFYKDELPVSVITANVVDYPFHFHDDMEIVYVLSGSIVLKSGYYTYTLKQGDMFILNDRDMHSLERTNEDNMVMMLQMDLSYFERYYSDLRNQFFVVDMEEDREEDLAVLRNILAEIMMEILQKGQGFEHKVIESTHNLISCLIADFCYVVTEDGKFQNETGSKTSKILAGRLNRIMDYMYENYEHKLTLSEIAENEKLSIYYLSHIIKEACSHCDQFFMRDAAEQLESHQQGIRAPFFDAPDHLRGTLHVDDQIFDIRTDFIARKIGSAVFRFLAANLLQRRYFFYRIVADSHGMHDSIDLFLRQDPGKLPLQICNAADFHRLYLIVLRIARPRSVEIIDGFQFLSVLLCKGRPNSVAQSSRRRIGDGSHVVDLFTGATCSNYYFHRFFIPFHCFRIIISWIEL